MFADDPKRTLSESQGARRSITTTGVRVLVAGKRAARHYKKFVRPCCVANRLPVLSWCCQAFAKVCSCLLLEVKRTSAIALHMSAFDPKRILALITIVCRF
jgi:hypothetical protein